MNAGILVSRSTDYTYTAGSNAKVSYDVEKYDPGDNFDTTTSEYTAPLTGYYLVANHLLASNHEAHQIVRVNGVPAAHDHVWDQGAGVVAEPTVILRLNAGDKLSVTPDFASDGNVLGESWGRGMETWLSVALLYAE